MTTVFPGNWVCPDPSCADGGRGCNPDGRGKLCRLCKFVGADNDIASGPSNDDPQDFGGEQQTDCRPDDKIDGQSLWLLRVLFSHANDIFLSRQLGLFRSELRERRTGLQRWKSWKTLSLLQIRRNEMIDHEFSNVLVLVDMLYVIMPGQYTSWHLEQCAKGKMETSRVRLQGRESKTMKLSRCNNVLPTLLTPETATEGVDEKSLVLQGAEEQDEKEL